MDIQISSNFERYLFELCDFKSETLRLQMEEFSSSGSLMVDHHLLKMADVHDLRFQKTLDELGISDLTLADELNKQLSTKSCLI